MSKSFLLLTLLLTLSFVDSRDWGDIRERDKEKIEWTVSAFRGMWEGFYKGFYNNKNPLTDECLG